VSPPPAHDTLPPVRRPSCRISSNGASQAQRSRLEDRKQFGILKSKSSIAPRVVQIRSWIPSHTAIHRDFHR
jgi:hypothetical protein